MSKIIKIKGRQVFDSRGNPTVEAEVYVKNNSAKAICPSGASTGTFKKNEKRLMNIYKMSDINVSAGLAKNFKRHLAERIIETGLFLSAAVAVFITTAIHCYSTSDWAGYAW